MKKKGHPGRCGELESLKNCSKERTVKFEVLKWESLKHSIFKRPVLVERMNDTVTKVDNEGINIGDGRSRRKAATSRVIKRKFKTKTYFDIFSSVGVFEIKYLQEKHVPLLK